jgi:SOS-response transcriptional repressor LexA
MQEPLSPRRRQVYDYICRFYVSRGYPPSLAEIAAGLSIARSTAQAHVDALQARGYLACEPGKARAIAPVGCRWPDAEECVMFAADYARRAQCVTAQPWSGLLRQALRALGRAGRSS